MNETSRISSSRACHGSRPSTFSVPSYGVSPRIAFNAVVFPAPFGPIRPRMRPSSTRRSIPSRAFVAPKVFRNPRASMHAMISALLFRRNRNARFRRLCVSRAAVSAIQQFVGLQPQALNGRLNARPFLVQKFLPLTLQQQSARPRIDKHSAASPGLDQPFVHQFLITLQDRKRIHPIFRRNRAYRGQRISLFERTVENHRDHAVAKLAVYRLTVVPLTVHPGFPIVLWRDSVTLHVAGPNARGPSCPRAS